MKIFKILIYIALILLISLLGYMKFTNSNVNDIALKVFGLIKSIKGESVDLSELEEKETALIDHQDWTVLLKKHVADSGKVNYKGFIQDKVDLEKYLTILSNNPPGKNWDNENKLAYWINAYNAFTVKLIIDNYPLKSIKDISSGLPMINSPWDIKFFKIGNTEFDLNTIEHEILRKQFDENRIHFAINCASFSCPKLRNEAFESAILDQQLDEQTKGFINNPDKNLINESETKLSKIFSWFESDFTRQGNIKSYIKKYHTGLNEATDIQYLEYIWTLNE